MAHDGESPITRSHVRVSDDLTLYYEEAGQGTPLVFIPGWTMTSWFFRHQITHFSRSHRVLVYDPRGQGRSSRTLENNHYAQHAVDLAHFIAALGLKDVILAGWSYGCPPIWGYVRKFGLNNVKAFAFIDQTPKSFYEAEGEWWEGKVADWRGFVQGVTTDRRGFLSEFSRWMVTRPLAPEELTKIVDESMKTPDSVAIQLAADGMFADYSAEAIAIDGKRPVFHALRQDWSERALAWITRNTPAAVTYVDGGHMMFWENPKGFNAALGAFLATLP